MSPNILCMPYWPKKNPPSTVPVCCVSEDEDENRDADASAGRFVRYQFTPAFLKLRTVGATWVASADTFVSNTYGQLQNLPLCLWQLDGFFFQSPLYFPTGWNLQLEIDPWTIFGWLNDTTSVITCWRASTLTLVSVSQTVETPVSTFTSSPSCLRAWVSHFNQVTLIIKNSLCDLQCLWTGNVITFQLLQHYFLIVASAPPLKIRFMQQLQHKYRIYS